MASNNSIRKDRLGSILDASDDAAPGLEGLSRLTHRDPATLVREDEPEYDSGNELAHAEVTSETGQAAASRPGRLADGVKADLEGLSKLTRRDPAARPSEDAAAASFGGDQAPKSAEPFKAPAQTESLAPKSPSADHPAKQDMAIHLSQATAERLEMAKEELAGLLPPEAAKRLSASLVGEVSLRIVLGDLEKKGEKSLLATVLRKLLLKP